MKDLLILIVYFGEHWPSWFSLFLKSCEKNSWIDWKIFTNIAPIEAPNNVEFISFSPENFKQLSKEKIDIAPTFTDPYKVCDFRIAFGKIFEDYIKDYKYWGHGDIDVIYGDLKKFIAPLISYRYDVISLAYNRLTGHLGLLRNSSEIINKFKELKGWENKLRNSNILWISEYLFSKLFNRKFCFFQDLDPFDRFIFERKSEYKFTEGLWLDGSLYVKGEKEMVEVPIYHFYVYLGRYRGETLWKTFKKIVHVAPNDKKWRITDIGILPVE